MAIVRTHSFIASPKLRFPFGHEGVIGLECFAHEHGISQFQLPRLRLQAPKISLERSLALQVSGSRGSGSSRWKG